MTHIRVQEIYYTGRPLAVPEVLCAMTKSYIISIIFFCYVFLFLVCLFLSIMHMECMSRF